MVKKVKVEVDPTTKEWFKNRPVWMAVTMVMCEKCGVYYKADLGHKCKKEGK